MKITICYDDTINSEYYKTLRITLPKSWKNGTIDKVLLQFINSYNDTHPLVSNNGDDDSKKLILSNMHLAKIKEQSSNTLSTTTTVKPTIPLTNNDTNNNNNTIEYESIPIDAIVNTVLKDRDTIYVRHGASVTLQEVQQQIEVEKLKKVQEQKNTIQCIRFGCMKRFNKNLNPFPGPCIHHTGPPVFHETAKFWSCCPTKKAYDFDEFQLIPGCSTSDYCTNVKDFSTKSNNTFLGGMDLREQAVAAPKLKSIDEFNQSLNSSNDTSTSSSNNTNTITESSSSASLIQRLENIVIELDIDKELFQQFIDTIRIQVQQQQQQHEQEPTAANNENNDILLKEKITSILKETFKSICREQLRIK